jgi:hypothetical protein
MGKEGAEGNHGIRAGRPPTKGTETTRTTTGTRHRQGGSSMHSGEMPRAPRLIGALVTAVAVAVAFMPSANAASSTAPPGGMSTCTIAEFGIGQGDQGAGIGDADANGNNCVGFPEFAGVNLAALGFPTTPTKDNYAELKAVLERYTATDGAPSLSQWIALSPAIETGMRSVGLSPTALLQWFGEADVATGDPWPPFVPKPLGSLTDWQQGPLGSGGAATTSPVAEQASQTAASQEAASTSTPPPQSTVTPTQSAPAAPKASSVSAASATTPAASTSVAAPTTPTLTPSQVKASMSSAKPTLQAPPAAVSLNGVTVPCSVSPTCAPKAAAYAKGQARLRAEPRVEQDLGVLWARFGRIAEGVGAALVLAALVLIGVRVVRRRMAA